MTLRYPNRSVARPFTAAFSCDFTRDYVVLLTDQSQNLTALRPVGETSLPSRRDLIRPVGLLNAVLLVEWRKRVCTWLCELRSASVVQRDVQKLPMSATS